MTAKHVVIVNGYGCNWNDELRGYLDCVVRFCNERLPDCLIFCGGFSQRKSFPGTSEALLMYQYVILHLTVKPLMILGEQDSLTTIDNISGAARILKKFNLLSHDTKLTVFCEATCALKTDLLVRHFICRRANIRANIKTASWELVSPEKQIISTLYDWAAIKIPLLARYWRWKRRRRAERI